MVYFARRGEFVKVGFSSDPARRIAGLQTASPERLTLVAAVEGDRFDEEAVHALWAPWRTVGEWFAIDADIRWLLEHPDCLEQMVLHAREALEELRWWRALTADEHLPPPLAPQRAVRHAGPRQAFMLRLPLEMLKRLDVAVADAGVSRNRWLEDLVARRA